LRHCVKAVLNSQIWQQKLNPYQAKAQKKKSSRKTVFKDKKSGDKYRIRKETSARGEEKKLKEKKLNENSNQKFWMLTKPVFLY
jgi:hypothetical protein